MPYAYEHLTDQQKNSITGVRIESFVDNIQLSLGLNSPLGSIEYKILYNKFGNAITTVKYGSEELPPIDFNFVDVFMEDLETLLKQQNPGLRGFYIGCEHGADVEERATICGRLEAMMKTRRLRLKSIRFDGTTVAQAMSIVQYLDKSEPLNVCLTHAVDPENFRNFRNGLREAEFKYDDSLIEFKLAEPTVRSVSIRNQMPVDSNMREIVARIVLENRLTMQIILKHFQCFDIERLRKVNRGIRQCVDLIKPNPHIETYSIIFEQFLFDGHIDIYIELENGDFKTIEYDMDKYMLCSSGKNFIPGTDYKSMFLKDMGKTLSYQMECMKELIICYQSIFDRSKQSENLPDGLGTSESSSRIEDDLERRGSPFQIRKLPRGPNNPMETIVIRPAFGSHPLWDIAKLLDESGSVDLSKRIGRILAKRDTPLKTKKFSMGSNCQMEIMEILPAIDTHSLRTIELLYPSKQNFLEFSGAEELSFEVDQLSQTAQWKNAEHLFSKYLTITTSIPDMNILNFVNLEILVKTISSEDVAYLRTNLLNSSKFQKYKISFRESTIEGSLHTLIGEPYRIVSDVKKVWYFRIQNSNDYIHIVLDTRDVKDIYEHLKPKLVTFTRVAKEDTPFV